MQLFIYRIILRDTSVSLLGICNPKLLKDEKLNFCCRGELHAPVYCYFALGVCNTPKAI